MAEADPPVGGEIDAWCTRCKLDLNHTVVAKLAGKVKRVQCLTCGGQHNFSPAGKRRAGTKPRGATRKRAAIRPPAGIATPLAVGRPARPYAPVETYSIDDVIDHSRYGRGRISQVRGDKIDVEFESGTRTLIHGWASDG